MTSAVISSTYAIVEDDISVLPNYYDNSTSVLTTDSERTAIFHPDFNSPITSADALLRSNDDILFFFPLELLASHSPIIAMH
jgi:hypothetical protein